MKTFENLVGNTEAYIRGDEVGIGLRRLKRVVRKGGGLAKRGAKLSLKAEPHMLTVRATKLAAKGVGKGLSAVTGPIRRRIFGAFFKKLISRRARLISWQRRGSLQPSGSERQAARSWSIAYVRRKGVLGKLVGAALAGDVARPGDLVGEPASAAILTASIPLLIKLVRRALKTAEQEGAPTDPRSAANAAPVQTEAVNDDTSVDLRAPAEEDSPSAEDD